MHLKEKLRQAILSLLLPLIYLIFVYIFLKTAKIPQIDKLGLDQFILVGFIITSLIVFVWSQFLVKPTFCLTPKKANCLITTGPYRFIRHPTYISLVIFCLALTLLLETSAGFWYTLFVIGPINLIRGLWEEKILLETFGKRYQQYRRKTLI